MRLRHGITVGWEATAMDKKAKNPKKPKQNKPKEKVK